MRRPLRHVQPQCRSRSKDRMREPPSKMLEARHGGSPQRSNKTTSGLMNPWLGKALVLVGIIGAAVIRAPHGRRSAKVMVVESRRNRPEVTLLALMWIAMMILPLVSIVTPVLSFADYPLHV